MAQDRATPSGGDQRTPHQSILASSYYGLLGVHPSASVRDIRQSYRELSKLYHPDTTSLARDVATSKFQQLNEAYATLSNPERRLAYDQKIGYSRVAVVQSLPLNYPPSSSRAAPPSSSAYLDPTDRPLSAGEVFALFILGLTFLACLVLAIAIGLTRGEAFFQISAPPPLPIEQITLPNVSTSLPEASVPPETLPALLTDLQELPPNLELPPTLDSSAPPLVDSTQPESLPDLVQLEPGYD